jgi:hypothetical protein
MKTDVWMNELVLFLISHTLDRVFLLQSKYFKIQLSESPNGFIFTASLGGNLKIWHIIATENQMENTWSIGSVYQWQVYERERAYKE